MVETGPDERNRSTTGRLRALAGRLSDDDLAFLLDPPWTTSALFAHIAFWDRFVLGRWTRAGTSGSRLPDRLDDTPQDLINDAALPAWLAMPARIAVAECLASADAIDDLLSAVAPDVIEELVTTGRERLVDRSLHRGDHLRALEAAFPSA
jgi:hypothetical protein